MGLGKVSTKPSSSSRSSSNSSSSSPRKVRGLRVPSGLDPEDFPIFARAKPQYVLKRHPLSGDLEFLHSHKDGIPVVEMKKERRSKPWEFADARPGEWERHWWTENQFKNDCYKVEKELGLDLVQLLKEQPEKGLNALVKAAQSFSPDGKAEGLKQLKCAVCGEEVNEVLGDWTRVDGRVACDSHTVPELKEAGLI